VAKLSNIPEDFASALEDKVFRKVIAAGSRFLK